MNELIEIADKIHNTLSCVLIKYHKGLPLDETEDEVLAELYIAIEKGDLKNIENLQTKENKYIKQLIMPLKNKNTKPTIVGNELKMALQAEVLNISGEPFTTGNDAYFEIAKLLETKVSPDFILAHCRKKTTEQKLTVKHVLKTAVLNDEPDKKTPNEKFDIYKLAMKIEREEGMLTTNEKEVLKKAVGKVWGIEVTGFVWNFIDSL